MRRSIRSLPLLLALAACGGGSPREPDPAWIADAAARLHPLASIDAGAQDDSDLAFLARVLDGRRIVGLGESSHGVAQYSRAKTRLVKYLHERLGYDVLVWESSILAAALADAQADTLTAPELTVNALPSCWHTEDVVELLAYVKSTRGTARPLRLAGMDVSFASAEESARRPELFRAAVLAAGAEHAEYAEQVRAMDAELAGKLWNKWREVFESPEVAEWELANAARLRDAYRALADFLEAHRDVLAAAYVDRPFLPEILRQAALGTSEVYAGLLPGESFRDRRDAFMASAFGFLEQEVFPGAKLVIWAHDSHLFKAGTRSSGGGEGHTGYRNTGEWLAGRYGDAYYVISLLMSRGRSADGVRNVFEIRPAPAWSIEGLLHAAGAQVAFLDLAGAPPAPERAWMDQPFEYRDFGLDAVRAVPREQMDGVLYLDAIDPPAFIDP